MTRGKWSQPEVPHKGWHCVGLDDLGEMSGTCEMCETQEIRYVHHMRHPDYPEQLGCGCICAGNMEQDYEGARQREVAFRKVTARRRRWLSRQWYRSYGGNPYVNVDGYNIVVFQRRQNGGQPWGFSITNRRTADNIMSRRPYSTENEAKLRAFDGMIWMKDRGR